MFAGQSAKYDLFRAQFKIWIPSLVTLDGIDFSKDEVKIADVRAQVEQEKAQKLSRQQPLSSIPEEAKSAAGQTAGGAAAGGGAQRSY